MAAVTKGSVYSSYGDNSRLYIDWQQTGQSIEKNETYIKYQGGIQNGDWWYSNAVKIKSAYINGVKVFGSKTYSNVTTQGKVEKFSGTATIKHGSDGKKKFTIKIAGWFFADLDVEGEKTFELTPIPRVSDLSLDVDTVLADGTSQVIATATKKADAFTDVLTVSLGDHNKQIISGEAFTIPMEWIEAIPTTSAVATVKVETFTGETSIGTKTVDLTVAVPDSVVPVINDLNISEAVAAVTNAFGDLFVQNLSQLNVSVDASGVYGSTVKSYSVILDGVNYIQQAFTSNVIKTAGTLDIKVKVTDSRGRTAEDTFEVVVIEYVRPTITSMAYVHCDPEGSQNSSGDSTKVTIAGKVYPVEGQNTKTLTLKYKSVNAEGYSNPIPVDITDWNFNVDVIINGTDPTVTYEYVAELTDKINGDSPETSRVATGIVVISRKAGGTGVTVGGEATEDGFVSKWEATFEKDVVIKGNLTAPNISGGGGGGSIEETDPTVPEWAKAESKPTYTAEEVGADPSGTADKKVSDHNTNKDAHNDIRILLLELQAVVTAFLDTDEETMNELSELITAISNNKTSIEALTTGKVNVTDIIDNLETNLATKPLSAAQGVVLNKLISDLRTAVDNINVPTKTSELENDSGFLTDLPYGVCSTAAGTKAKVVNDVPNFVLKEGAVVIVKFSNSNTASSPTLNVNGTGAKAIRRYGTTAVSTGTTTTGWIAGAVQLFVYDGTAWIRDYWSNTTYSNASLGNGYGTCDTAEATIEKTATLSSYALSTGGQVSVKFTNAVPANATLDISEKGAKAIYFRGEPITAGIIMAGDVATFIYNGSYYHLLSIDRWQNDIEGLVEDVADKMDKDDATLGLHTDGLIYLFVDGQPTGSGVAMIGGETGDVVGNVDSGNTLVLKGGLADGEYFAVFEMEDGRTVDIGNFILDSNIYYSVTNNLTNCTSGNSAVQAVKGGSYSAKITAKDGYELKSVAVTMGGTNITPSAVSGGNINITNVTGNIVITAVAEVAGPAYTNQIPLSIGTDGKPFNGGQGWKTGYRLSLSGGGESAQDGTECTGFIPVKPSSVIRIKNIAYSGDTTRGVVGYDANFNKLSTGNGMPLNGFFVTNGYDDGNGVRRSSPLSGYTHFASTNLKYIRLCSTEITANSILTVDEPITD